MPLKYNAPRALYGAHMLFSVFLAILCIQVLPKSFSLRDLKKVVSVKYLSLALIFLSFQIHLNTIFSTKNQNARVMARQEAEIVKKISQCPKEKKCTIPITKPLNEGLKRDWVLHRDFWPLYLDYIKKKHYPDKKVEFTI